MTAMWGHGTMTLESFDEIFLRGGCHVKRVNFFKYHALGNDYIVIDPNRNVIELDRDTIRIICHRNFGIGSDGILYGPIIEKGLQTLRILNPDGSEAEKSGNGIRIFSKYLFDSGYVSNSQVSNEFELQTKGGLVKVNFLDREARLIKVDMGGVTFMSHEIPVSGASREVVKETLNIKGKNYIMTCVSVGNPHCVILSEAISKELACDLGPHIENHSLFPNRINVQFLRSRDKNNIEIEIWERGAGYTLASGSSSCGAASAARKMGLVDDNVHVHMPGGMIAIDFDENNHVHMTGTVSEVYEGFYMPCDAETTQDLIKRMDKMEMKRK